MQINIERNTAPKQKPNPDELGFGRHFSDHMFLMDYHTSKGWHNARIIPYQPLSLDPSSTVFHYGVEIFEGMKAYRTKNGDVQLFRPYENAKRFNRSAERMTLPHLDEELFVQAVETLVDLDKEWVPSKEGTSLYIRPFMFANDAFLGVHTADSATFIVITSPSGAYYKEGLNPVKIMIETEDVRAVRGGTGFTKCGGNYAGSLRAGERAGKMGYSQVLWLDGIERKYIEEVGAMNVMFKIGDTIVTPPLEGTVLAGITRMSILSLLSEQGIKVEERKISVDELIESIKNGSLQEAFGCGTAAVVSPIGTLRYKDVDYQIQDGGIGELTQSLYNTLTEIQWGDREDTMKWTYPVGRK